MLKNESIDPVERRKKANADGIRKAYGRYNDLIASIPEHKDNLKSWMREIIIELLETEEWEFHPDMNSNSYLSILNRGYIPAVVIKDIKDGEHDSRAYVGRIVIKLPTTTSTNGHVARAWVYENRIEVTGSIPLLKELAELYDTTVHDTTPSAYKIIPAVIEQTEKYLEELKQVKDLWSRGG